MLSATKVSTSGSEPSVAIPRPSTLQLPSGRMVYMRPIHRDSASVVTEEFFKARNVGLVILVDKEAGFQSMQSVNERFTPLVDRQTLKVQTFQAYLQSTGANEVTTFADVLRVMYRNIPEGNVEIWGPVYETTFLAMCCWLYENYRVVGESEKQNFFTVQQAFVAMEEKGEGLAELEGEQRQQLERFVEAYLQHLKQGSAPARAQGKLARIWEWFKRSCCCCCTSCCQPGRTAEGYIHLVIQDVEFWQEGSPYFSSGAKGPPKMHHLWGKDRHYSSNKR